MIRIDHSVSSSLSDSSLSLSLFLSFFLNLMSLTTISRCCRFSVCSRALLAAADYCRATTAAAPLISLDRSRMIRDCHLCRVYLASLGLVSGTRGSAPDPRSGCDRDRDGKWTTAGYSASAHNINNTSGHDKSSPTVAPCRRCCAGRPSHMSGACLFGGITVVPSFWVRRHAYQMLD